MRASWELRGSFVGASWAHLVQPLQHGVTHVRVRAAVELVKRREEAPLQVEVRLGRAGVRRTARFRGRAVLEGGNDELLVLGRVRLR
jgi:hypothetical protein